MQLIMVIGFGLVMLGCFAGSIPMVVIGFIAQVIGTFGSFEEMHRD